MVDRFLRGKLRFAIISLVFILGSTYAIAEPTEYGKVVNGLQLIMKSDKAGYKQGEQIKLDLVFKNTTDIDKEIKICVFDIEHKLKEGLVFSWEDGQIKLKDWTKRKLPVFTEKNIIHIGPRGEYKIELKIDTSIPENSSWKYVDGRKVVNWGEGMNKLPNNNYKVSAIYACITIPIIDTDVWVGTIFSNIVKIRIE